LNVRSDLSQTKSAQVKMTSNMENVEFLYSKNKDSSGRRDAIERWKALQKSKAKLKPFFNNERSAMKRTPLSNLFKAPAKQKEREKKYAKQAGY